MIAKYRKKPSSNEYFLISSETSKPFYHLDEETARAHFDVRKRDTVSCKEWILYHVIEKDGKKVMKVLDIVKREKPRTFRHPDEEANKLRAQKRDENLLSFEETLKYLAGEINAEEEEEKRIPHVRRK